jgi:transcriptional regulator with GAF, ATPase, and Fis domain
VCAEFVQDATTKVQGERRGIPIPAVDLVVIEGPSRGKRVAGNAGSATVGTGKTNLLTLDDPKVSRLHCELLFRPGVITLRDRGSTNGTFVEGVRVRDVDLPAGAIVRVGASAFRIEVRDEPAFVAVSDKTALGELVGESLEMRRVYAILERVAATDATVLVQGETGTGKDVVAQTIHGMSRRAGGAFVPIDCGSIPANLFESELFGHVRGAFSGAVSDRRGVFDEAAGGTLFLDEIGEVPLELQPKLLRALETRTVRPVGANVAHAADVRIVAATNRPLWKAVNDGAFREDLYYRLAVVEVALPPLRARPEDLVALARHFFRQLRGPAAELSPELEASLVRRDWPGNVRELRNFIERGVALGFLEAASVAPRASAPPALPASAGVADLVPLDRPLKDARVSWTKSFESVYVRHVLVRAGGNVTRAAELAGVSRRFLQRLIVRLGITASEVGSDGALDEDDVPSR